VRVPRRAAVALSAIALAGGAAACAGDDTGEPAGNDSGVEEPSLTDPEDVADPDVPVAPDEEVVPEDVTPTS
jgi:hypothetical protein